MVQDASALAVIDPLFTYGQIAMGLAIFSGTMTRAALVFGAVMMGIFYFAQFPPEHDPLVDYHIVCIAVYLMLGALGPVDSWVWTPASNVLPGCASGPGCSTYSTDPAVTRAALNQAVFAIAGNQSPTGCAAQVLQVRLPLPCDTTVTTVKRTSTARMPATANGQSLEAALPDAER